MKKFLMLAAAAVLLLSSSLYAGDLSVGLNFGLVPNMSNMGETILKDGAIDLNGESLAYKTGVKKLIWADNEMAILRNSSAGTNFGPGQILSGATEGAPMNGVNIGLNGMYDLTKVINLPLFARLGFDYAMQYNSVKQSITLGDGVDMAAVAYGYPAIAGGYAGGKATHTWKSWWWEMPITVGGILNVGDKGKVYAGIGLSYVSGGWSIQAKYNAKYVAYLTSYTGLTAPLVDKGINSTIKFEMSTLTINYLIGAEYNLVENVALTMDLMVEAAAQNVFQSSKFSATSANAMTGAIAGPGIYGGDPKWIKEYAYPSVITTAIFKVGAKYYIPM